MGNQCYNHQDEEHINWKNQLEATCSGVKEEMCWAEPILIQLKDLRCSNKYQKSLHNWAQSFENSTMYPNSKSTSKTSSKSQTRNVDTIIRRTGFTEEDLIENYVKPNRNSFNGSIQSVTPSYIYHEKTSNAGLGQSQAMFEDQLAFFVSVTDQMKCHLEQQNELALMITQFRTALISKHKNSDFECLHEQLTLFCRTLYETLVVYYDLITLKKKYSSFAVLVNEDTILNFIVNYVMSDQGIYQLIYNSIDRQLKQVRNTTEICLRELKNVNVKEMGIPKEFQLITLQEPYKEAILLLQKMNKKLGPSSKVKLIIKCSQLIQSTIREVNYTRGSSLLMQADDLIPIMKYILARAQIYDIDIQLTYIEKLITNGMLNSSSGYYVITMLAALSSIRENKQLIQ